MSRQQSTKTNLVIKTILALTVLIILSIFSITFFFIYITQPIDSQSDQTYSFTIKPGEGSTTIANRLYQQKLIKHPLAFKLTLIQLNLAKDIQAGNFNLSPSQSTPQIARSLTKAFDDQVQVTLLEGWRREEIATELTNTLTPQGVEFDPQLFLSLTSQDEGYLFPDTYFFSKTATTEDIVAKLKNTFTQKTTLLQSQTNNSGRSLQDIIIMASIVEREARGSARPIVAGILWKRLDNDWPLQADATLQYIKGTSRDWWPEPLGVDKELSSPYNTYQNQGLPPAPITNPSLSSIEASISPQQSDYWYYISDLEGNMHYSQDYDQHLRNIDTYLR